MSPTKFGDMDFLNAIMYTRKHIKIKFPKNCKATPNHLKKIFLLMSIWKKIISSIFTDLHSLLNKELIDFR